MTARPVRWFSVTACVLAVACAAKYAEERKAMNVRVRQPAFEQPQIMTAKSLPPQFDMRLVRQMPTAGWTLTVDAVEVDVGARRIVARVSESAPDGMAAQVITPVEILLSLGALDRGRYFVEIWLRRGDGPYAPEQALVLEAG